MTQKLPPTREELDKRNRYLREYRAKNRETIRAQAKARYYADIPRTLFDNARKRSQRFNTEFTISVEDIEIPEVCPVFKIPFVQDGKKGQNSYAPSLDRIDSSKGYVKDNIRVICTRANVLKNSMTKEECLLLVENAF